MEMVPLERRGGSVPSSCGLTARHSAVKMLCMSAAKGKIIPPRSAVRPGAWLVPLLLALAVFVASPVLAKMPHAPRGRTGENALAGTAAVTGGGSVFNAPALQNPGTVNFSGDPYGFQYGNLSQSPGAGGGEFAGGPLTAGSAALRSVYTAAAGVYGAVQGSTSAVNAVNDFQSGNTLGGSLNAAFSALNFGGVGFSAAYPAQSITSYADNTGNLVDSLASSAPVSALPRTVSLNVLNPEFTPTAAENAAVRQTLYHYTNEAGLNGILEDESLDPSLKALNPNDVRYGNGQYLSDIVPGTKTPAQLSRAFLGQPFQGARFTHYIQIDVTDLNAIQGRPGVFVIPNETPLDLAGRIVGYGANQ